MYYALMGAAHSRILSLPGVDVPKPKAPDSDDIIDKGNQGSDWLSARDQSFWTIIIVLVVAAIIATAMKRPFVRGMIIGLIALAVVMAIVNN
jgi:hypothetical protein